MQGKRKKKRKTTIKGKGDSDTKPPTPCGICNGNVNKVKSVYCEGCNRYIHLNRCTDEKTEEKTSLNLNFRCKNCTKGEVQTNDENEEEANALINDQTITNKRNNKRKTTEYEGLPEKTSPMRKINKVMVQPAIESAIEQVIFGKNQSQTRDNDRNKIDNGKKTIIDHELDCKGVKITLFIF